MSQNTAQSNTAFEAARHVMPGGVSSPARACKSVGAQPVFIDGAEGAWLQDIDGNSYIDYVGAFGPMILGHNHPSVVSAIQVQAARGLSYGAPTPEETALAERIASIVPSVDRVRLVNSGTEATMSALRLARGFTGRARFIKFAGCYHGHADSLLVKAGSGALTLGTPDSAGVTAGAAGDTLVASFNDLDSVARLFTAHPGEIAAVLVEPVAGNMGVVPPQPGFLEGLKELTEVNGAVLIFDEVMTGFRVALAGAQGRYGVTPDLTCLGKIVGGGLPVGAYGGREEIMASVAPEGPVYQAGTNSGNPLSMAAGITTLDLLVTEDPYPRLETLGARLQAGLETQLRETGCPGVVQRVGSMITLFFTAGPVVSVDDVTPEATARFGRFWRGAREQGIMLPPSQYEAWFISAAHDEALIDETIQRLGPALAGACA